MEQVPSVYSNMVIALVVLVALVLAVAFSEGGQSSWEMLRVCVWVRNAGMRPAEASMLLHALQQQPLGKRRELFGQFRSRPVEEVQAEAGRATMAWFEARAEELGFPAWKGRQAVLAACRDLDERGLVGPHEYEEVMRKHLLRALSQ